MTEEIDWTGISAVLDRPFGANEIKHYSNGQQSFAYIDARQVAERLDEAVGKQHWHDEYLIPRGYEGTGAVQCILTLHGVSKMDVGYPNAPIDAVNKAGKKMSDEPLKDAHSDALKRAAVHWGVGRHLYEDKPKQGRQQDNGRRVDQNTGEILEPDNPFDGQGVHNQETDPGPTVIATQRELAKARSAYAAFHHVTEKEAMAAALEAIKVPASYAEWTVQHYTALTIWLNSNSTAKKEPEPDVTYQAVEV